MVWAEATAGDGLAGWQLLPPQPSALPVLENASLETTVEEADGFAGQQSWKNYAVAAGSAVLFLILVFLILKRRDAFELFHTAHQLPKAKIKVRLDARLSGGHCASMDFSKKDPEKQRHLTALALVASLVLGSASPSTGQVDDQNRSFIDMGVSIPTEQANPSYTGVIYWNQLDFPREHINFNMVFAGPYNAFGLIFPEALGPDTALFWRIGSLIYFDSYTPEYVLGRPLRDEEFNGYTGWTSVGLNHEFGTFTEFNVPLNFSLEYRVGYTTYNKRDQTPPSFRTPSDHIGQELDAKLQFGGVLPGLKNAQGLDLHLRYIVGHRSNWNEWGPESDPFTTYATYQRLIFGAALFAPLIADQTFGLQLTAQKGFNLDRTTMTGLGGSLRTSAEATRIAGYFTREFLAEDYLLANFSYEIPIIPWQDISLHFYADQAAFRRGDDRAQGWQSATGLGAGVSLTGPFGGEFLVSYGYGIDAIRKGERGGQEVAFKFFMSF